MVQLTFILGTGRCGSTLLSTALSRHLRVLSLSEFFTALDPRGFPAEDLDGAQFWRLLTEPRAKAMTLLRTGVPPEEYLYPFGAGRFTAESGVPPISLVMLPHLTDDPDGLYDELAATVPGWPSAPVSRQYARLFELLRARLDRDVIVERSGASLRFLPGIVRAFPTARYVYLDRDGVAAAVSMSRHSSFRLGVRCLEMAEVLGVDPFEEPAADHVSRLPEELRCYLPDRFDPVALMNEEIPIEVFGMIGSRLILDCADELASIPAERLSYLSYEDVLADPAARFAELAGMVGVEADPAWVAEAAALVRPAHGPVDAGLSARARDALAEACAPGRKVVAELRRRISEAG